MRIPKSLVIALIVVVVIIFIAVGVLVGIRLSSGSSPSALSPYSAVYLSTGDIYFGKLSWSPSPHMEDAWFLQRSTDAKGNATVGVYPFSQVAWGPSDEVSFNAQQIIFWARLSATSSIAQLIANPSAATAQQQSAAGAEAATGSPSAGSNTNSATAQPTSTTSH